MVMNRREFFKGLLGVVATSIVIPYVPEVVFFEPEKTTGLTLLELAQRMDNSQVNMAIAEILVKQNEILNDAEWIPSYDLKFTNYE